MAHHFTDNSIFLNSFSNSSDPNTVMAPNFNPLLNPAELETPTWSIHSIMGFPQESFFTHESSEISTNLSANIQGFSATEPENGCLYHVAGNKKKLVLETPESSWANSSPPDSENGITIKNRAGKEKKQKSNFKNEEKRKDVVHVRARRGQATDSHSLAERVRRNKINEKLRCLQDIVPGCHKTVGMAAMLDEIINYVQSLQNQVEFLSMKLTAASNFQDFNAETDTMNMMIQRAKAWESEIIKQKMLREIFEEKSENGEYGFSSNEGGPFDHSFGSYPLLPNNK